MLRIQEVKDRDCFGLRKHWSSRSGVGEKWLRCLPDEMRDQQGKPEIYNS